MMEIDRLGKAEQHLENALNRRRRPQVGRTSDEVHFVCPVIDDAGEMISGGGVLAGEDYVIEFVGTRSELQAVHFRPRGQAGNFQRLCGIEPPAMWPRSKLLRIVGQAAARTRITRRQSVRRFERGSNIRARAETGISQPLLAKLIERCPGTAASAATGKAQVWTSPAQASAGPLRWRPRTRAGFASGRDPRSSAGTCRRFLAPAHGRGQH